MSLMYPINTEIYGPGTDIDKNYTHNVMIAGFGIFFGPILTGYILDVTRENYDRIFMFTAVLYLLAAFLFSLLKFILIKNVKNNEHMSDYEVFDTEEETF